LPLALTMPLPEWGVDADGEALDLVLAERPPPPEEADPSAGKPSTVAPAASAFFRASSIRPAFLSQMPTS